MSASLISKVKSISDVVDFQNVQQHLIERIISWQSSGTAVYVVKICDIELCSYVLINNLSQSSEKPTWSLLFLVFRTEK